MQHGVSDERGEEEEEVEVVAVMLLSVRKHTLRGSSRYRGTVARAVATESRYRRSAGMIGLRRVGCDCPGGVIEDWLAENAPSTPWAASSLAPPRVEKLLELRLSLSI